MSAMDLHASIMNLPCRVPTIEPSNGKHDAVWSSGYQHGYRTARHDAAELAAFASLHMEESQKELVEALKMCAAVCAGESMNKNSLIHALEKASDALSKATAPASKAEGENHG